MEGCSRSESDLTYSPLISLGDLLVQRRNARRKFAASLNPSASAISSFASLVGRFVADAEAIYSYEGTREMNTLIVGKSITGLSAFV